VYINIKPPPVVIRVVTGCDMGQECYADNIDIRCGCVCVRSFVCVCVICVWCMCYKLRIQHVGDS